MGGLAQRATLLHRRVLARLGVAADEIERRVPTNRPIELLAEGIFRAWWVSRRAVTFADVGFCRQSLGNAKAAILCVVENVNQNQLDQRFIEYELERLAPGIKIVRITLTAAFDRFVVGRPPDDNRRRNASLRLRQDADGNLRFDDYEHPIGFVYFRAGYSPDHYESEREWEARLRMETSTAIKCPWIGLQLANTKKVQQVLAAPHMVERFLDDARDVAAVRATFAGLWGLEHDDESTRRIVEVGERPLAAWRFAACRRRRHRRRHDCRRRSRAPIATF